MTDRSFRPVVHPQQADTLVHFCGRGKPSNSSRVGGLSAEERLDSILQSHKIWASPPYDSDKPVISFTESGIGGVERLIQDTDWEPWGLVFTRNFVWERGGGPVWYARREQYQTVRKMLPEIESWLVRTEPQASDWLHEREWRLVDFPADSHEPGLDLNDGDIQAILVGDKEWEPPLVHTMDMNPLRGGIGEVLITPQYTVVERWFWNGKNIERLEPLPVRFEPLP